MIADAFGDMEFNHANEIKRLQSRALTAEKERDEARAASVDLDERVSLMISMIRETIATPNPSGPLAADVQIAFNRILTERDALKREVEGLRGAANGLAEAFRVLLPWERIGYLDFLSRNDKAAIHDALTAFAAMKEINLKPTQP